MTRFRDLAIGQTFDFVDDANPHLNSFFSRCTKMSARRYTWEVWGPQGSAVLETRVGSINVEVFHVH